jgi:hypothetical protein
VLNDNVGLRDKFLHSLKGDFVLEEERESEGQQEEGAP